MLVFIENLQGISPLCIDMLKADAGTLELLPQGVFVQFITRKQIAFDNYAFGRYKLTVQFSNLSPRSRSGRFDCPLQMLIASINGHKGQHL